MGTIVSTVYINLLTFSSKYYICKLQHPVRRLLLPTTDTRLLLPTMENLVLPSKVVDHEGSPAIPGHTKKGTRAGQQEHATPESGYKNGFTGWSGHEGRVHGRGS